MRTFVIGSVLLLVCGVAVGATPDQDNNGIIGDEPEFVRPVFDGVPDRDAVVAFPTAADTWEVASYPYWWHAGDTVYGMHDPGLASVDHADVILKISYNVLNGSGHVDLDFRIDGTTVGSVVVTEADGLGYVMASFDFASMVPPFELRWYETNLVDPGAGSVSLDETGECEVIFSGPVGADLQTWGDVKRLYH
jgi:hypothetical protein